MRDPREDCTDSPSTHHTDERNPRRAGAPSPPPGGEERVGEKEGGSGSTPNAFDRRFLDLFARRDPAPALPEADNAGPWRVAKLHGADAPRWGGIACGERPPRFNLQEPDVAHMVAAGLSLAERPPRFRFQVDAAGTLHLMQDGHSVGTAQRESESLPVHLTGLDHLRRQPLALAHFLMAVPDEVLDRAGTIVMEMVDGEGRCE